MKTFKDFLESKKEVDRLSEINEEYEGPGLVYFDSLIISPWHVPSGEEVHYLIIENMEYIDKLEILELRLFAWAHSAGYCD